LRQLSIDENNQYGLEFYVDGKQSKNIDDL
jgi:hypothetical protein